MDLVDLIPIVFVGCVFLSLGCKLIVEYFEARSV